MKGWKGIAAILVAICMLAVTVAVIPASTDHSLSAKAYCIGDIPVVEVTGDDKTSEFMDADLTHIVDYNAWVEKNITDGKKIPLFEIDGCSAFNVNTDHQNLSGRNLEFTYFARTAIIVKNTPYDGYRSIGIAPWIAMFDPFETMEEVNEDIRACAAPMFTMDGMNEKGLMCALLVDAGETPSASKENTWGTLAMMRYLLDHAASVEEATEIIQKKGFCSEFGVEGFIRMFSLHVIVSDIYGQSIIIESINGKLFIMTGEKANVVTNHSLNPETKTTPYPDTLNRYNKLKAFVNDVESHPEKDCTVEQCRAALESVSRRWNPEGSMVQSITRWSVVYDHYDLKMYIWFDAVFTVDPLVFDIHDMYT